MLHVGILKEKRHKKLGQSIFSENYLEIFNDSINYIVKIIKILIILNIILGKKLL